MWTRWIMMIVAVLLSVSVSAENLLVNGNFESGAIKGHFANGYPDGWDGWSGNGWHHPDSGYKRDSYGIAIWSNDTGCYQVVAVSEGTSFEVACEMIYPDTGEALVNKNAQVKVEFRNSSGAKITETVVGLLTPSHTADQWYSFSETVTAPAGAVEVRVICMTVSTGGSSTGKAFWDNLSLDAGNTINSPDYDDSLIVDLLDFEKLASVWAQVSSTYNLSGADTIDLEDLTVFSNAWLTIIPDEPVYELVWSDEFNGPAIDTNNWNWEIGDSGWGNNEWQYYTNHSDNSYIDDGDLVIVARKDHLGHDYTSARMTTKNKQSFLYGRLEARVKLPVGGAGIWPAFWMLGDNIGAPGWPECGEIDILESINNFTQIHGTLHFGTSDPYIPDNNGGSYTPGVDLSADYHVYAIEWEPTVMRWYFDDVHYYTTSNWWSGSPYPAPFNQNFFFILNVAVGGNWPQYPDASTPFPQSMYIDYVRVYQKTP